MEHRVEQEHLIEHFSALADVFDTTSLFHVFIKDPVSLQFIWVNKHCAALYGLEPSQMLGLTDADLYEQSMAEEFLAIDRAIVESRKPSMNPHTWSTPDMNSSWSLDTKFVYLGPDQEPIALIGFSSLFSGSPRHIGNLHAEMIKKGTLQKALRERQFGLFFQPQVDRQGRICKVEALARWFSPGLIHLPSEFIPFAENSGLMVALGNEILGLAFDTLRRWRVDPLYSSLVLSINISPKQLNIEFFNLLSSLIQADPDLAFRLCLEITETSFDMLHSGDIMEQIVCRIHTDLGVRLSIDDFGKEYSSLSKLEQYPISELKIDKSFVDRLVRADGSVNVRAEGLVRSIVVLGHTLGCEVIAEGVETAAQLRVLKSLGADYYQGFLDELHAPVPESELGPLLRRAAGLGYLCGSTA